MPDVLKHYKISALANWTYSGREWKYYIRWKRRNKGFFHYVWYSIIPIRVSSTPTVAITHRGVFTDNNYQAFRDADRQLRHITITDAGKMNIMEITYEITGAKTPKQNSINILVPKGKLKEAIQLQEKIVKGIYPT
jgi:hypothetical protein